MVKLIDSGFNLHNDKVFITCKNLHTDMFELKLLGSFFNQTSLHNIEQANIKETCLRNITDSLVSIVTKMIYW